MFRGKISEGIDFADAYARAVVCIGIIKNLVRVIVLQLVPSLRLSIGIPYSHLKDLQVILKKAYNDAIYKASRSISSTNKGPIGFDFFLISHVF